MNGSTILRKDKRDATQRPERNNHTHIGSDYDKPRAQSTAMQNDAHSSPSCIQTSRHDKHDTHIKTKHTTHPAPGDMSTTTHHSSRSTAAPMSSLPLPPHFCSAMIVVAPLLRCAIQSAVAALGLAALSYQPSIHHFPTRAPPTTCPPTSLLLA